MFTCCRKYRTAVVCLSMLLAVFAAPGADLKTKSGRIFRNYSIKKGNYTGIYIAHGSSLVFIPIADLPDEIAERYAADLKTKKGDVYYDYSVVEVEPDRFKIKHKWGTSWVDRELLPDFLLERYGRETGPGKADSGDGSRPGSGGGTAKTAQNPPQFSGLKKLIVTGSGINEQRALEAAFRNAVRQAVGVYVITRSTLKDSDFKEEIYVNSDAVISSHRVLKQTVDDGLVELTVEVVGVSNDFAKYIRERGGSKVSSTEVSNLLAKRDALNVALKSVPYIFDELMGHICTIRKTEHFKVASEDKTFGENLVVKAKYAVRPNDKALTSGLERMMALLDRVCVCSRFWKNLDSYNHAKIARIQQKFAAEFRRNKTDGIVCFIDKGHKVTMQCYVVPHQLWEVINACRKRNELGTVFLALKLKDLTSLKYAFRADINCWRIFTRVGDKEVITFFRDFSFNCHSGTWQGGIKADKEEVTLNIPQTAFRKLDVCEFSLYPGRRGQFLFAKHFRNRYEMQQLADRGYGPAMICMAEDFGHRYYYHRAALRGSSYAMGKLGWKNRGLGFIIRNGKIFSIDRSISGLAEGLTLEKINGRELPRGEEELSRFIGSIPSGASVALTVEGGRNVTVTAR